jgi:hypothetical protein
MEQVKYLVYFTGEDVPFIFKAVSKEVLKKELTQLGYNISCIQTKY